MHGRAQVVAQRVQIGLDELGPHAGPPLHEALRAHEHRGAHDGVRRERAMADAVRQDQLAVEAALLGGVDAHALEGAEAGVETVDRDAALDHVQDQPALFGEPLAGGAGEHDRARSAGDGDDVGDADRRPVQHQGRRGVHGGESRQSRRTASMRGSTELRSIHSSAV